MNANTKTLITVGRQFCADFVAAPYVCYTEHGQHAYFFALLYAAFPKSSRYVKFNDHRLCVIQKEYPTATNLGRSKRQHWDISVIKVPPPTANCTGYDYLPLQAVAEFGMNEDIYHLKNDIDRLTHRDANVRDKFAFHLYRFSAGGRRVSRRDWSANSGCADSLETIAKTVVDTDVTLFFAVSDRTGRNTNGAWLIRNQNISQFA
jgi:hypothetical protein